MSEFVSHTPAAHGAGARPSCDPLASVINILDEAHRELGVRDLTDVLVDVDRLATAMLVAAITAEAQEHANGLSMIGTEPAYRIAVAARLDECNRATHGGEELARCARRLHAYVEDVAARPRGCAVPSSGHGHRA